MTPIISIVMSVYNGATNISETIKSVLNQTFSKFEFIIINDGSTDETPKILEKWAKKDKRIKLITVPQIGLTKSLNKGIRKARGKYIARIDSGDTWRKDKINLQVQFLKHNPDTVLLGTQAIIVDKQRNIITETNYPIKDKEIRLWFLKGINPFLHSSVVFKNNNFFYNENFCYAQDFELWSRLFFKGRLANLKQKLTQYQISLNSISFRHKVNQVYNTSLIYHKFVKKLQETKIKTVTSINPPSPNLAFNFFYKKGYRLKPYLPFLYKILIFIAYLSIPDLFFQRVKYKLSTFINFHKYKKLIKW